VRDLSGLSDLELIGLVRSGDDQAFGTIVERYEEQIARTVIGMLGNTEGADDVGQETFIRFYRSIHKFRGDASLGTYLTRIAINLSLNELKKRTRTLTLFYRRGDEEEPYDVPEKSDAFDQADAKELVDKALAKLDPPFRAVVVLRMIDGYSTRETAEILDLPVGTVLSRLARAQKSLRDIITPIFNK